MLMVLRNNHLKKKEQKCVYIHFM